MATRRGLTYKPSDIRKNGVRVLRSSNIAEDSFVLSDEDVFVVREAVNIDCVRANDILITAANGSSRLVGKHTIISGIPEESAVHGGFMLLGTTKEPHFVNASMGSSWYRRFIELFVAGGNGAIGNLNKNDLDNQDIAIPSEKEQKKIGSFFRQLDNLITLHQRKCVFLFGFFQAFISMIFTASTFSWEQRKFDEVFDCTVPNNTLSRAELSYDEGTVLNVHYGDVLIKYGSVLDVQKDDIPRIPHRCREDFNGALLQDGDVIIADTAEDETTGKACEIGNLQGSSIVSGLHTMVCRPRNRMALGYLGYYLNSNAYHHQLLPLMQGIKVLSLSRSNIQKTSVSYPIAVKEQQLIAYYFSQLDNLITLHQRKGKAAVSGCFLNCSSLEKSSAQSRTLELFGQTSNQEIKYIIDGLSILGGKLRNFCVKLIILLSYTRINDIAKYHISRNTECVHNIN